MKVTIEIVNQNSFLDNYVLREELSQFAERLQGEYDCDVIIGRISK